VFIEPFRSLWRGEENSSTDMAVVVDNLVGAATDYGCGVILSHHERKGGAEDGETRCPPRRGSTVLEGASPSWRTSRRQGRRLPRVVLVEGALPPAAADRPLRVRPDTGWYRYVALDVMETSILLELERSDEPMNVSALSETLDESRSKVARLMKKLSDEGRVKLMPSVSGPGGSTGHRYRLPSDEADDNHGGLSLG
jgi:hypothetical protein